MLPESGRRIAILGARSAIGRRLLDRLAASAAVERLVALDLVDPGTPGAAFSQLDLTHPGAGDRLARILERERIDALVHLARPDDPPANPAYFRELELGGTGKVLAACRRAGTGRLILRSSTWLHWPSPNNPAVIREQTPFADGAPEYVRVKRDADARALAERPDATILRFAPLLGPEAGGLLARALRGPFSVAIAGFDPLVQCLHVDDAAAVIEGALEASLEGVYHVAAEGCVPYLAACRLAGSVVLPLPQTAALYGLRALRATGLSSLPDEAVDALRFSTVVETSRLRAALDCPVRHDARAAITAVREEKKDARRA